MRRLTSVLALSALFTTAVANPIQPIDMVAALALLAVVIVVIQLVVVLIEGAIYARKMPVRRGRAYGISLVANLSSFVIGLFVEQLVSFLVVLAHVEAAGIFV